MAKLKMVPSIVEMTPSKAQKILARNDRNRVIRADYVRQLAGAMERGEWIVNGEPIQIAADGTLLNGQHRLSAVVESGASVPMLVVRGLPSAAQMTMDVGGRRTLSDVLALHGEIDTTNLAAVLGLLYRFRNEDRLDYSTRTAPTISQALALLEEEQGLHEALVSARHVFRETRMRLSVAALLLYLFEEADPGAGQKFFDALCNPSAEEAGSGVRKLRGHLDRIRKERKYRFSTIVLSAMTIKAFNAWREGRSVVSLSYRAGRHNPEEFPKILTRKEIEGG